MKISPGLGKGEKKGTPPLPYLPEENYQPGEWKHFKSSSDLGLGILISELKLGLNDRTITFYCYYVKVNQDRETLPPLTVL